MSDDYAIYVGGVRYVKADRGPGNCKGWPHDGMSLRDWFAGQALMSLPHLCAHDTLLDGITFGQHVARNAYEIADAMIAAREKPHD